MSALLAPASSAEVRVGEPLPAIAVRAQGKVMPLDQLAREGPVAILQLVTDVECDALRRAAERLAGERVRLVIVGPERRSCGTGVSVVAPVEPAGATARLIVVDAYGVVRMVQAIANGAQGVARTASLATDWEAGRQSFIVNCAHCHGNDGADTSYNGVKTLAGIARRLTGAQILDGGRQFGAVDMSSWTDSARQVLLLYIQGL